MFECPRCHAKLRPGVRSCSECHMADPLRSTNAWFFPVCIIAVFAVIALVMRMNALQQMAYDSTIDQASANGRPIIDQSDVTPTHDETVQTQKQVEDLLKGQLGTRLNEVKVSAETGGGYMATVRFMMDDDSSADAAKASIEADMKRIYKILYTSPIDLRLINLFAIGLVQNADKNRFQATVYSTELTTAAADLIDWNHIDSVDMTKDWETISMNPAFESTMSTDLRSQPPGQPN